MTDFAFATCLPGMETALKREVLRDRAQLRFAYSRPGFITFRSEKTLSPDDESPTSFAWVWGQSLGPARDPADAAHQLALTRANRVHLFARDADVDITPWRDAIQLPTGPSENGELVADVVLAPDEPAWLGLHRADARHLAWPGGRIPIDVPSDVPSRAFAKIEEAIAWRQLPIAAGQVALEVGAAPGGAVMALARRGLTVFAVDTADLAPQVLAMPNVRHLRTKVGALRWEELPARVDWLLLDVNLAPQVALHEIARIVPRLREHLRGAVLTLKLNEWRFVDELGALRERIVQMGFRDVQLRHLPSNRREVCAVALC
ncbi:MAG: hypothetical protein QM831_28900 [Kofleriaceae bacterium]